MQLTLPGYARTAFRKSMVAVGYDPADEGAGSLADHFGGLWKNAAAVTQLDLLLGAGKFDVGTVATLWGRL